jgi:two-component system phosphate regulon sensor histidine kinase PhoR
MAKMSTMPLDWIEKGSQEPGRMHNAEKVEATTGACEAASLIMSPTEINGCRFEATLLAMAGHDLRQPLQVIQNVQDRLNDGLRTSAELRLLRVSQNAIDRMTEQLDQLLDALRVGEHGKHIQISLVNLGALLRDVHRERTTAALQKGIQIRLVETHSWVKSNELLLGGVIRNLVDNAIKYTKPGGRILLGCRHARDVMRIDVLDTGIGISEEHIAAVFDAFTRVDTAEGKGLGIGLFIVRQAIAVLGHQIGVSSVAHRGTRFSIFAGSAGRRPA